MTPHPVPAIVMTPPERAQPAPAHPRRPPAHRSVSLLHSPKSKAARLASKRPASASDSSVESVASKPGLKEHSPSSLQPNNGKDSSGESSNAERWFEQSNNRVQKSGTSFTDNDPPFFMRQSSSSEVSPDSQQHLQQHSGDDVAQSLPLRAELLNLGEDGSSTDDFRGVIDDLTVENQKLKRRLKKYEKLHDAHLKHEKLFEVRIHGLPADKKQELEETLRNFAASLSARSGTEFPANGYEGLLPTLKSGKTASSQTSLHNADSAYASMSASGQGSSAVSATDTRAKNYAQFAKSKQQNIHSYLHDIPEGLLPQQNPSAMTERARKKVVVRRLEQIFAGRGAANSPHDQALQQEDVSQTAARADRSASEAQGQAARTEGKREASVMLQETEDPLDLSTMKPSGLLTIPENGDRKVSDNDIAAQAPAQGTTSPDQRPTRPLDLDPHRAQVPAENLRYIRHLGFSPTDPEIERSPEEGHGWIYLNLLVNMAQLHTYHVTVDYVREALSTMSDKFELSDDGRKVRWKGGASLTRTSSDSGRDSVYTDNLIDSRSPRKKIKFSQQVTKQSGRKTDLQKHNSLTDSTRPGNSRLMYTPLFSHKDSTEGSDDSSSDMEDVDNRSQFPNAGSSTLPSAGMRTGYSRKQKKRDDGPIIFYNNARFCTDLSGDSGASGNRNAPLYRVTSTAPIGKTNSEARERPLELRGPLHDAKELPEPMDLCDNPIPESMELNFPPQSPPHAQANNKPATPINLEVTGIGGVYPADNFAITVESRHAAVDQEEAPTVNIQNASKNVPSKFIKILEGNNAARKVRGAVTKQTVASKITSYPPSQLPPAHCFMPFSDDEDDESDADADGCMSITPESNDRMPPSTAPMPLEMPDTASDESEVGADDADSDGESDGSLDLLATARKINPEAIWQKEREYDANMAERLAEEIPAGSSAATAGGGSGFASPASGIDKTEYQQAVKDARRPPGLKMAEDSGDSMAVEGMRDLSESESEEDDEDEDEDENEDGASVRS